MKKIVLTLRRNTWIKIILFLVIAFVVPNNVCIAGAKTMMKKRLVFAENKGQIIDQYGNHRTDIDYKTGSGSMSVFVGSGHLYYQFHRLLNDTNRAKQRTPSCRKDLEAMRRRLPDTTSPKYQMYPLDMTLVGANPHALAMAEDKQAYHENYHTSVLTTDSCSPVCTYSKVTYKNIYPNIDWVLYIKDNRLEYDFIVNPGGNVDDIKIRYDGADAIASSTNSININTPMGNITEKQLYAYDQDSKKPIPISYTRKDNTLGYALTTNHSLSTIIIDPVLAWGTYFGDIGEEEVIGKISCDKRGNIILNGFTSSVYNIATTGAHQTTYMGNKDAFIAKFDNSGTLLWATYYGGSEFDVASSSVCDSENNIYIVGYTGSTTNIATPGSHKSNVPIFGYYLLVAKFSSSGSLIWGTYYGGGDDDGRDIALDNTGNIYVTGQTSSDTGIATSGCFQEHIATTASAFLSKFSNNGVLLWGTYFGIGTVYNSTDGEGCVTDKFSNIYLTGGVIEAGIVTTPGCYQSTSGGDGDCYIAKFDSMGVLIWSTYYGGDSADVGQSIISDTDANVYISGLTASRYNIASVGALDSTYNGGLCDAFLVKFNQNGNRVWATYYGGTDYDDGQGLTNDGLGNIYMIGSTTSLNNIATPGSWQDIIGGWDDAYIAKFNTYGHLLWASYYGGSNNDVGGAICSDGIGNIYCAGYTYSSNNIASSGSFLDYLPSPDSTEAFLVKFDTGINGIKIVPNTINALIAQPNPNNGNFVLTGNVEKNCDQLPVQILDVKGNIIYGDVIIVNNGVINQKINLKGVTQGAYVLQTIFKSNNTTIKIIIR